MRSAEDLDLEPWALDLATLTHLRWKIRKVSWHKPLAFWHIVWTLGFGVLRAQRRESGPWALDLTTVIHF